MAENPMSPSAVPGNAPQPSTEPIDEEALTIPLEQEDGSTAVIAQQPSSAEQDLGSGEWPDPDAPARGPSPGSITNDLEELPGRDERA
jgi:hypothetical protein